MGMIFDTHLFAACVRTKRGGRSLRQAAAEIEAVSPATLLRFEQEQVQPDLLTFLRVCEWLGLSHRTFVHRENTDSARIVEVIEQELRADGVLAPSVIDAFLTLYRAVRTA